MKGTLKEALLSMNKKRSKYDGKALILGNDNRSFLTVIRSLGRKNICIHVGWCDADLYALKSKYISKYHQIPPFSLSNNDWKNCLIKILKDENYDIVIPCHDPSIIPLQLNKKEFSSIAKIYLLYDKVYAIANDKFKMSKLAKQLGINVPKEIEIYKSTTVEDILAAIPFPMVLKQRTSFTIDRLDKKRCVHKVYTIDELKFHLDRSNDTEVLIAQKNIIGNGAGIELLAHEGEILYAFQHIRIHEPLTGGGSSYRKSVHPHPELLDASAKLMQALKYTGVAMVEFKINLDTNDWVFIELNARFWGSLPLPVTTGADFPYYLYLMLVRGKKNFPSDYKKGIYCRNLSNDINWFLSNLKADRSDPTLATLPLWRVALEFVNIISLKERSDTLVADDIKPGLAELTDIIRKLFFKLFQKVRDYIVTWHLFLIIQKHITLRALKKVRTILFLCKGNICRSPFAHYYFKTICPSNINITSCGYYPIERRTCPLEAIETAKRFGIDLTTHRSNVVNENIIQRADIIFTFDGENLRTILSQFPSAKSKIYRISSLDINTPLSIKDPYGQGVNFYFETYKKIKQILDSPEILEHIGKQENEYNKGQ